ncbi:MAG: TIGR02147 family protein, partial [Chitinispirillaceae bacterium]|nr:TIGR02147 family protein [Chitinispirillaceae bacterium]
MINLFDYDDFRIYLSDWYKAKKSTNPKFSYQMFAEKAGIKNKGFIYNIINGKKQLSRANAAKLSMAIGHNRYEAEYFENLVSFNQAKDIKEQRYFFERMCNIKNLRKSRAEAQILREDQYEFYSQWYHATIRSIIDMYGFKDDYKWLAKMINPPISV